MKILVDGKRDPKDKLIASAQEVWLENYSSARSSPAAPRADKGLKRKAPDVDSVHELSEAQFLKRRRDVGAEASASAWSLEGVEGLHDDIAALASSSWSEDHAKEQTFARKKQDARRVEALGAGHLLDTDHADAPGLLVADLAAVTESKATFEKDVCARHRREVAAECHGAAEPLLPSHCSGKHVFFADGLSNEDKLISTEFRNELAGICDCISKADIIVAPVRKMHMSPSNEVFWASALIGACLVSPSVLRGDERRPLVIRFPKAVLAASRRRFYLSEAFRRHHPRIANVVCECVLLT